MLTKGLINQALTNLSDFCLGNRPFKNNYKFGCARWGVSGALQPAIRYSGAEYPHREFSFSGQSGEFRC